MRAALWMLLAAVCSCAQDASLARLKREAAALQAHPEQHRLRQIHIALRDWIEARLPARITAADVTELSAALTAPLTPSGFDLQLRSVPQLPGTLLITAGVPVECGLDQAVYLYRLSSGRPTRILEDHPGGPLHFMSAATQLSEPDPQGRRLLLTHFVSAQCASTWMVMSYSVYRIAADGASAGRLLSAQDDFWLTDTGPEFVLRPTGLTVRFLGSSIDPDAPNRTRIFRYGFTPAAQRLDPVALRPQDFVEEWLQRPWSEMQTRSAASTRRLHDRVHADSLSATNAVVQPCAAQPGYWRIDLEIDRLGRRRLRHPLETWFLVQDLGGSHYLMKAAGAEKANHPCGASTAASSGGPGTSRYESRDGTPRACATAPG